jgi:D-galactarolactone cycloisomerase
MTVLRELRAIALRAPIAAAVRTSFGVMRDRPMLLVRIQDDDGAAGWGEVWCNFPSVGAEHRARLLESVCAPLLSGADGDDPPAVFERLTRRTRILAIQSGEFGPLAQAIAGVDLALWDLKARKSGMPLFRLLGGTTRTISVYASGLGPDQPQAAAVRAREAGYRAFKLKVGFGLQRDLANLRALRGALGEDAALMVDANQGWDLPAAAEAVEAFAPFRLEWLEEPLPADAPHAEWERLAARSSIPLAAGENLTSRSAFDAAIAGRSISVLQPDVTKWGGLSACLPIARAAVHAGKRLCPHFLGGAVGLAASAHFLAAVGGDGRLEVDVNDNPLRTTWAGPLARIADGTCRLDDAPGISIEPDADGIARYGVLDLTSSL